MLLAGIIAVIISIAIITCLLENGISDIVLTGAVALYDCLNQVLWNISIVCQELLRILWQAITTITKAWIVVMCANTWVKAYTFNDSLGIKTFDFCICIKLVEVTHSQSQIGIGKELNSFSFLHAHKECIDILLDGTFLQECSKSLGCFFQHLYICHSIDCLILFCKLRTIDNLWITYDNTTWVKVVIECLALTKELWREKEVELLHSLLGILQVEVAGVTYWDGTLDDHHCIWVYFQYQVDYFFYVGSIEVVLHWVVIGWCCNHHKVCISIS